MTGEQAEAAAAIEQNYGLPLTALAKHKRARAHTYTHISVYTPVHSGAHKHSTHIPINTVHRYRCTPGHTHICE